MVAQKQEGPREGALLVGVAGKSGCWGSGAGAAAPAAVAIRGADRGGVEVVLAVLLAENQDAVADLEVGITARLLALADAFDEPGRAPGGDVPGLAVGGSALEALPAAALPYT